MQIQNKFLFEWVLLTALGWWLGCFYLFSGLLLFMFVAPALNVSLSFIGVGVFFGMPFGFCIGIVQWRKLSHLNIHQGEWLLGTALGWGIFFAGISFVLTLAHTHSLLLVFGFILTFLLSGFAIGAFQALVLKRILVNSTKWILANLFGILALGLLALGIYSLAYELKSVFLKFFYSQGLYDLAGARDYLLFGFLVFAVPVLSALLIGRSTGKVLIISAIDGNDA